MVKGARKTVSNDLAWNKKQLKSLKSKSTQFEDKEENILFSDSEKRMIDIKRLELRILEQIKEIEKHDKEIEKLELKTQHKKRSELKRG